MKMAVITSGFSGSTLPLEKRLLQRGFEIDHYQVAYRPINELESFPLKFSAACSGVHILSKKDACDIYKYMESEKYSFSVLKLPRPYRSVPVLRSVIKLFLDVALKKVTGFINRKNYDLVLFVGLYKDADLFRLVKLIKLKKVVALHEVCDHRVKDFDHPNEFLKYLSKNKFPIVVFSNNSLQNIYEYGIFDSSNIYQMNFGVFEGFSLYSVRNRFNLPTDYILYLGSISSYKGLDVLYDAVNCANVWPCKFVVAGSGSLDCVEKMKKDDRFIVINRFLKNEEFAELISRSKFIVCPYRSASQSGIPQTAFVFNKPIVASNIKAFEEIIGNRKNGLLFEKENAESLCNAMLELLVDKDLYEGIQSNVFCLHEKDAEKYSWNCIADKYENLFKRIV